MIQWITDFSHRVSQLQEVSRLVSQGGAKEIKVYWQLIIDYLYLQQTINEYPSFMIFCLNIFRVSQFGSEDC